MVVFHTCKIVYWLIWNVAKQPKKMKDDFDEEIISFRQQNETSLYKILIDLLWNSITTKICNILVLVNIMVQ